MSDPALTARRLGELHRVAQERLGVTATYLAYTTFVEKVDPMSPEPGYDDWLKAIVKTTLILRKVSRRLASRYYTLARAIGSGYALPDIDAARPSGTVAMGTLYEEFAGVLNEVIEATSIDLEDTPEPDLPEADADPESAAVEDPEDTYEERLDELVDLLTDMFEQTAPEQGSEEWNDLLPVDSDWDWEEFLTEEDEPGFLEDLYADLEVNAFDDIQERVAKELRSDAEQTAAESAKKIDQHLQNSAASAAAYVDKAVVESGRAAKAKAGDIDKRRYGWMRVTSLNPCAFCAMLASRGAVYDTRESAGFQNVYHLNCHCDQIPVYLGTPHYSARDEYFINNWAPVTRGYSGKNALNAWRRWLTRQYRESLVPVDDLFTREQAAAN